MIRDSGVSAYFEAKRVAKVCIEEFFRLRIEGCDKLREFCKRFPGANSENCYVGNWDGEILSVGFKSAPDKLLWMKDKRPGQYRPRLKTPEGKALAEELATICIPQSAWVKEKLTGKSKWCCLQNPGVYLFKNVNRAFIEGGLDIYGGVKGLREIKASEFHLAQEANEAQQPGEEA